MPKVDLSTIQQINHTGYSPPHDQAVAGRWYRRLAPALGIDDFGVSHVTLKPGAWSSQRHWHEGEDELVVVLAGEAVLVENDGRTLLKAGDIAAWPKGVANGHHLVNDSDRDCIFIAIGRPAASAAHYPDIDLHLDADSGAFVRKSDAGSTTVDKL